MMRDGGQPMSDSHILLAALDTVIGEEGATGSPKTNEGSSPSPDHVFTFADLLDDVERVRIANANRLAALTEGWSAKVGSAGKEIPAVLAEHNKAFEAIERAIIRDLQAAVREHPLGPWCASVHGLGEKALGRFLAVVGDPASRRQVSSLWRYCGMHVVVPGGQDAGDTHAVHVTSYVIAGEGGQTPADPQRSGAPLPGANGSNGGQPTNDTQYSRAAVTIREAGGQPGRDAHCSHAPGLAPRPHKGQKLDYNPKARVRLRVIAESLYRLNPDYKAVYDEAREKYSHAVHHYECRNRVRPPDHPNGCGTSEHPEWGAPGSPLRPGHQHARAMRAVMKQFLIDLWVESRRVAGAENGHNDGHVISDTHVGRAVV